MGKHKRLRLIEHVEAVPFTAFGTELLASAFRFAPGGREVLCLHLALDGEEPLPVRLHSGCVCGDVFGSERCDCAWQLRHAVDHVAGAGRGIVVYLPGQDGRGAGIPTLLRSYLLMDEGMTSAEAFSALGRRVDARDYSPAIAALAAMNLKKVRPITNNPTKIEALAEGGFVVDGRVPSVMETSDPVRLAYLRSKARMGHLIEAVT